MPARNFKLVILLLLIAMLLSSLLMYVYITKGVLKTAPAKPSNGFSKFIKSSVPIIESSSTDKVGWAKAMLMKFPYNKELHAGILLSKRPGEVWIVGKGGLDAGDPKTFLTIDLGRDTMRVKITPQTEFTAQADTNFDSGVEIAGNSAIQLGDLLIIRATLEGENVIALAIRKLTVVNSL